MNERDPALVTSSAGLQKQLADLRALGVAPGVPSGTERLRCLVRASHREADLRSAAAAIADVVTDVARPRSEPGRTPPSSVQRPRTSPDLAL
jgi:hypothetical protein